MVDLTKQNLWKHVDELEHVVTDGIVRDCKLAADVLWFQKKCWTFLIKTNKFSFQMFVFFYAKESESDVPETEHTAYDLTVMLYFWSAYCWQSADFCVLHDFIFLHTCLPGENYTTHLFNIDVRLLLWVLCWFSKNIIVALLYNLQSGTNLSVLECSPCEAAGFTRIHLVRVQVNQHRFGPISVLWGTNGGGSGERCFIQSPAFPFPNSFHGRLLGWFCVTNHPVRQVAWTHHKIKDADSEAETITRWTED